MLLIDESRGEGPTSSPQIWLPRYYKNQDYQKAGDLLSLDGTALMEIGSSPGKIIPHDSFELLLNIPNNFWIPVNIIMGLKF